MSGSGRRVTFAREAVAENPGDRNSATARVRKSAFMDFLRLSFGENRSAMDADLEHVVAEFLEPGLRLNPLQFVAFASARSGRVRLRTLAPSARRFMTLRQHGAVNCRDGRFRCRQSHQPIDAASPRWATRRSALGDRFEANWEMPTTVWLWPVCVRRVRARAVCSSSVAVRP